MIDLGDMTVYTRYFGMLEKSLVSSIPIHEMPEADATIIWFGNRRIGDHNYFCSGLCDAWYSVEIFQAQRVDEYLWEEDTSMRKRDRAMD